MVCLERAGSLSSEGLDRAQWSTVRWFGLCANWKTKGYSKILVAVRLTSYLNCSYLTVQQGIEYEDLGISGEITMKNVCSKDRSLKAEAVEIYWEAEPDLAYVQRKSRYILLGIAIAPHTRCAKDNEAREHCNVLV
jgi:hypothetical protein